MWISMSVSVFMSMSMLIMRMGMFTTCNTTLFIHTSTENNNYAKFKVMPFIVYIIFLLSPFFLTLFLETASKISPKHKQYFPHCQVLFTDYRFEAIIWISKSFKSINNCQILKWNILTQLVCLLSPLKLKSIKPPSEKSILIHIASGKQTVQSDLKKNLPPKDKRGVFNQKIRSQT